MEGDRILRVIKENGDPQEILSDIKDYLYPLRGKNTKDIAKYQLFAIKALKVILQRLSVANDNSKDLINVANTCVTLLQPSLLKYPLDCSKLGVFYYEKLLVHLANQSMKLLAIDTIINCYNTIYNTMTENYKCSNQKSIKSDGESLIKGMSDILWQTAIVLEKNTSSCTSVKPFTLRQFSIKLLLFLPSQLLSVLDRAVKSDVQLLKVEGNNDKNWQLLCEFHRSLLSNQCVLVTLNQDVIGNCQMFTQALEWLTQAIKSSIYLSNASSSIVFIEHIQKLMKSHYKKCKNHHYPYELLSVLVDLASNCVSLSHAQSRFPQLLKKSSSLLSLCDLSHQPPPIVSLLFENIKFFITTLLNVQKSSRALDVALSKVFYHIHKLVLFYVDGVEQQLKETHSSAAMETLGKRRQLLMMDILMQIFMNLFMHSNESLSQNEMFISNCLSIVEKSSNILKSSSSLPPEEYHCFGANAYNLGLIYYQMNNIEQAVPLLQSSCSQLSYYCQEMEEKMNEVKLIQKYGLLVECLIKLEQHEVAMETLVKAMMSSFITSTSRNNTKQVSMLISQFVRIKCLMKIKNDCQHETLNKTSADWLTGCHDNQLKSLYLEEELKAYESMRQDTREWQLLVAKQLVSMCTKHSHTHVQLLIKQASLYHGLSKDGHMDLLSEAIKILEFIDSKNSVSVKCMTLDLLGLAHLWKGIFLHAKVVSECTESPTTCKSNQVFTQFLSSAVDYWCTSWQNISHAKITPSCCSSCFLDYPSTLHHILLCISFTNSLHLSSMTLKLLDVLISLLLWSKETSDVSILNHALALKTHVLVNVYGIESITSEHMTSLCRTKMEFVEGKERDCISQLQLEVSKSIVYIQMGKMNESFEILTQVLSHPVFTACTQSSYTNTLLASVTAVTSYYLQCLFKPPLDANNFLNYLISNTPYTDCGLKACLCKEAMGLTTDVSFRLTDIEMALDVVKLNRGLSHCLLSKLTHQIAHPHQSIDETAIPVDEKERMDSIEGVISTPVYKMWEVISSLLESLFRVSQLYLAQGLIKECEHYTTEGLRFAKSLHLILWHVRFLLQLAKVHDLACDNESTVQRIIEAAQMLNMSNLIDFIKGDSDDVSCLTISMETLSISTERTTSDNYHQYILSLSLLHVTSQHLLSISAPCKALKLLKVVDQLLLQGQNDSIMLPFVVNNLQMKVKALLDTDQFTAAIEVSNDGLVTSGDNIKCYCHLPTLRVPLAKLHYYTSRAILLSIDQTELASNVWEGIGYTCATSNTTTTSKHKKTRRARRKVLSDSDEESTLMDTIPNELQPVISHLLTSCQYLSPITLSTYIGRDVYQLLGVCLSVWHNNLASHFLLLSSSISFNQESVFWFGRKLRKESDERSLQTILNDVVSTLTPSSSPSLLAKTRAILYPLVHPLPMTYTLKMVSNLPSDWLYCGLSLVERNRAVKVLVIVRAKKNKENVVAKLSIKEEDLSMSGGLLYQFSQVMTESVASTSVTERNQWWSIRRELDKQLKDLLSRIQSIWLKQWRILLLPTLSGFPPSSVLESLLQQHGICHETWAEILIGGAEELSLQELKCILVSLLHKKDSNIISKIVHAIQSIKTTPIPPNSLILSLPQLLHNLPIESVPILRDQSVTRIPSLSFLSAHLILHQASGCTHVDPTHTYYIINPSGDLKNTQKKFASWFKREAGWEGVVGRPPSKDEFIHGLKHHDTFIYCGHGKAREYLGRDQKLQELYTHATVLQMGCSSGKLQTLGSLDPYGMALNYLIAGCPFLVANLWDVTDQDIDRFCTTLVKNWLTEPESLKRTHDELLCNLIEARESCKLKYLIGASPIVYGIPVYRD